ncbi:MAG: glutamine-hydrolyzing carbamoyl-phosphate synthase small subunit [Clostridiales bacterium]|nr:glutamine-hydrolyzing carbamoyl-phosphate synthase small subunit [Clostridiales bacterium]
MGERVSRKLVLENGSVHYGTGFGAAGEALCELVFNTAMAGYQEMVTDPSYAGQMVLMTYPLIGNYGITDEDNESRSPLIGGMVVREYSDFPSNFRSVKPLGELLEDSGIPAISGVDTRQIARMIRSEGSQRALLCDAGLPDQEALERIKAFRIPRDCVQKVSCRKKWYAPTANPRFSVVALDCGIKQNIIRKLNQAGCNVTVLPYDTPAHTILSIQPDGLVVSNGPGDPAWLPGVIRELGALRGKLPMMGICLGHQLISLAYGAKTYKMKFGHRGANHPVKDLRTGKVEITSQNHGYAVHGDSLRGTGLTLTHVNLLDNTAEGTESVHDKVFTVQFHPEGAPGPHDSAALFARFTDMMGKGDG